MLTREGITWLAGTIAATAEAMGQTITANAAALMAADLADYTKDQLAQAMHAVRLENKGRLSLNAILQQLDRVCGRYGAEEAWALAVQANDEAATVVWNDEISQAWEVVAPMARSKDLIGARMAFKQAYERITQQNRAVRRYPEVSVSIGWDRGKRIEAISLAHQQGLLALAAAKAILAGDDVELKDGRFVRPDQGPSIGYSPDGSAFKLKAPTSVLGQLLIGNAAAAPPADKAAWQRLSAVAKAAAERAPRRKAAQARLERYKLNKAKQATDAAVKAMLAATNSGKGAPS